MDWLRSNPFIEEFLFLKQKTEPTVFCKNERGEAQSTKVTQYKEKRIAKESAKIDKNMLNWQLK